MSCGIAAHEVTIVQKSSPQRGTLLFEKVDSREEKDDPRFPYGIQFLEKNPKNSF